MNKTKTDQALIDRYVYDVIRRLPRGQREDIELEIRSLIDDIWEESPQKGASDILKSLGPPAQLAKKYRGDEFNYVIGPESCDSYWTIAKIISGCILIGFLVSSVIQMLKDTPASAGGFLSSIAGQLSSCLAAGFCAFGFLAAGQHCPAVAVSSVLCSLASLCIAVIILRGFPFWNPDFVTGLEQAFSKQITSTQDILYYWNTPLISNIILIIMLFSAVLESGTAVYKAIRYSLRPRNTPISFSKE